MVNPRQPAEHSSTRKACDHRLRRRFDYLATYDQGRKAHGRLIVVFGLLRRDQDAGQFGPWRLGMTATKKLGGAVVRNRLRRRAREIFRLWGAGLPPGWDFVLNFKHGAAASTHDEMRRDLLGSLRRLGIDPETPAGSAGLGPASPSDAI